MRSWRRSEAGSLARGYAWLVVTFRWFVVLGWVLAAVAAALWLPATSPSADLGGFAPPNSAAIATEKASAQAFGFPVLSRTMLVQRDENGLSQGAQQRVV
jgi:RND superfamily putative drug exporter